MGVNSFLKMVGGQLPGARISISLEYHLLPPADFETVSVESRFKKDFGSDQNLS